MSTLDTDNGGHGTENPLGGPKAWHIRIGLISESGFKYI